MFSPFDERMMRRAIELAALGRYTNHPNPRVGCVITQGERIVGEGWHRKWGEAHAEARALQTAGEAARGATVYVTLEPHSYQGRTPPCTDALIRAGVRRVICGALDPNPKVHGAGVRQLEAAGIEVRTGLLEESVRELNRGFEKRMRTGRPRVIVKVAASLDGRVALASGASRWITGGAARADVQRLRAEAGAVLTGIGTVIADDPQLNVRDPAIETLGRQPLRVVLDSRLRMPASARLLQVPGETLVFTAEPAREARTGSPSALGAGLTAQTSGPAHPQAGLTPQTSEPTVICVPADPGGGVSLDHVLAALGERHCNDVLVEAGPTLTGRILQLGLADELVVYIAPVLLGPDARPMALLPAIERLDEAPRYTLWASERIGPDTKLTLRSG